VALSHLARIPMPLYSFVLQLPSPSRCVWCQLDKFSFFFSPFISNLCRTMSTAISPSPPPTPVTATSTQPLQPPPCHPLHRPSHASRGTHKPPRRRRSHCAYFFLVFILF